MFSSISSSVTLIHYCASIQLLIIVFVDRSSPDTQMGTHDLIFCLNLLKLLYFKQIINNCVFINNCVLTHRVLLLQQHLIFLKYTVEDDHNWATFTVTSSPFLLEFFLITCIRQELRTASAPEMKDLAIKSTWEFSCSLQADKDFVASVQYGLLKSWILKRTQCHRSEHNFKPVFVDFNSSLQA